jgi:hypothetical protein
MNKVIPDTTHFAYCQGYVDGYEEGIDNNNHTDDYDRVQYSLGYDRGVAQYCTDVLDKPEE